MLLTVEECATALQKAPKSIRRALGKPGVYIERHALNRPGKTGGVLQTFIDPRTLTFQTPAETAISRVDIMSSRVDTSSGHLVSSGHLAEPPSSTQESPQNLTTRDFSSGHFSSGHSERIDMQEAERRASLIRPLLQLSKKARVKAIEAVAEREGVSPRTVYGWFKTYQEKGISALGRKRRADRGELDIPAESYQLIVQALVSNPPATSTRMIHRTLLRAVPDAMQHAYGGKKVEISEATVRRIRARLEDDPHTRLLFSDADVRKEHLRSYAGQVFSAHANHLWQMDMTRCDVMVCDVETGKLFRPRVHAIIDVFSGCIPGWAFAVEEDQTQTDLALLRAFVPKPEPYTSAWPVFGTPERLYWDNGKTYSSTHARRFLAELGVEVVYSRPRVSHTRGKIERFFGTLHGFEKSLPGYVGQNARDRATEELRRIIRNTRHWLERSLRSDPGWGNRLLTLGEYQERVMAWLLVEYHDTLVGSKSRLVHFLETVPARTQRLYNREELMTVLARRSTRTVQPNGAVRLKNRFWTVSTGELINFVGREVLVLSNQFAQGEEHVIAWQTRDDRLEIIGQAEPLPELADSAEAQAYRRESRASAKRQQLVAAQQRKELTDPHLIVSRALMAQAETELRIDPLPPAQLPSARLAALAPKEEDPTDDFAQFLTGTSFQNDMSPDDFIQASRERFRHRSREEE